MEEEQRRKKRGTSDLKRKTRKVCEGLLKSGGGLPIQKEREGRG